MQLSSCDKDPRRKVTGSKPSSVFLRHLASTCAIGLNMMLALLGHALSGPNEVGRASKCWGRRPVSHRSIQGCKGCVYKPQGEPWDMYMQCLGHRRPTYHCSKVHIPKAACTGFASCSLHYCVTDKVLLTYTSHARYIIKQTCQDCDLTGSMQLLEAATFDQVRIMGSPLP